MGHVTTIIIFLCLAQLAACGKKEKSSSTYTTPEIESNANELDTLQTDPQGTYRAVLSPINIKAGTYKASGTADIKIIGDNVSLRLTMLDTPANMRHLQFISTGQDCPTPQIDFNSDEYIDAPEIFASNQKILIQLDGDISTQDSGEADYPKANRGGYYKYTNSTSLNLLMQDLTAPTTEEMVVKLAPNEGINLQNRHMIILGVPEDSVLPKTVSAIKDLSKAASLPIACGKIVKIIEE